MTSEKWLQIQIYSDLDSAFDCLKQIFPRTTTNQKQYSDWVVILQQYGISAVVPILSRQSFRGETSVAWRYVSCSLRTLWPATLIIWSIPSQKSCMEDTVILRFLNFKLKKHPYNFTYRIEPLCTYLSYAQSDLPTVVSASLGMSQ